MSRRIILILLLLSSSLVLGKSTREDVIHVTVANGLDACSSDGGCYKLYLFSNNSYVFHGFAKIKKGVIHSGTFNVDAYKQIEKAFKVFKSKGALYTNGPANPDSECEKLYMNKNLVRMHIHSKRLNIVLKLYKGCSGDVGEANLYEVESIIKDLFKGEGFIVE